jgi:hypothetical protein
LVRAVVVVVATPVIVVDRRVEVRAVGAGVAVGVDTAVVVDAEG